MLVHEVRVQAIERLNGRYPSVYIVNEDGLTSVVFADEEDANRYIEMQKDPKRYHVSPWAICTLTYSAEVPAKWE